MHDSWFLFTITEYLTLWFCNFEIINIENSKIWALMLSNDIKSRYVFVWFLFKKIDLSDD